MEPGDRGAAQFGKTFVNPQCTHAPTTMCRGRVKLPERGEVAAEGATAFVLRHSCYGIRATAFVLRHSCYGIRATAFVQSVAPLRQSRYLRSPAE